MRANGPGDDGLDVDEDEPAVADDDELSPIEWSRYLRQRKWLSDSFVSSGRPAMSLSRF